MREKLIKTIFTGLLVILLALIVLEVLNWFVDLPDGLSKWLDHDNGPLTIGLALVLISECDEPISRSTLKGFIISWILLGVGGIGYSVVMPLLIKPSCSFASFLSSAFLVCFILGIVLWILMIGRHRNELKALDNE